MKIEGENIFPPHLCLSYLYILPSFFPYVNTVTVADRYARKCIIYELVCKQKYTRSKFQIIFSMFKYILSIFSYTCLYAYTQWNITCH